MKYSLNLASRSYINKRALYAGYLVCGIVLLAGLMSNFGYYVKLQNQKRLTEVRLAELEEKILASQGSEIAATYSAEGYKDILKEINAANRILERDAFRWTALLDQLEKVVPWDVSIENINPDHKKGVVKITGLAKDLSDMKRFLDNLIDSGDYVDVLLLSQSSVDVIGSGQFLRFSIELRGAF
ncbi:MAG: hypothetical protein C0623_03750 [Desulfuromonas sp.]|nr:MAG: hypothetical protein C0623_03750 [Desulfuromonas sp.]